MKRLLGTLLIASVAIAFATTSGSASAQDQIHVSHHAQVAATDIVNGLIISTENVVLDGEPHRVSEFLISDSPKGDLAGTILVEIPGGEFGDGRTMFVSHTPDLIPGEMVQLALASTTGNAGAGLPIAVNPNLEVYSIVEGTGGAHSLLPDGVGSAGAVGEYSLHGASWPDFDAPLEYKVNPSDSGVSANGTINAVKRGFQIWEDDTGTTIDFEYAGTTNKKGFNLGDGQTTVSWVNSYAWNSSQLAHASWIFDSNGNMLEFDVRFNQKKAFSNGPEFNHFDIAAVAGHEAGHGLGLNDLYGGAHGELMFYTIPIGQSKGLGHGDRAAVNFLYPRQDEYCAGRLVTVNLKFGETPTSGDDVIMGTSGDDEIDARDGDDYICAGAGYDIVHGGHGDDHIEGGVDVFG